MTGSTKPTPNYDAKPDAEKLRKAMKGIGTDEKELIAIIANRTIDELQKVSLEFKTLFGRDLVEDITSETSGNFRVALLGRLQTSVRHDAEVLRNAIQGAGTDEAALIEILASRSNAQIKAIKDEYLLITKRVLEKDIIGDTSGDFKRFLVSLVQGNRDESNATDAAAAANDAQAFYKAGEGKWGTDEEKFNQILASRSFAQLRLINEEYKKISKKDLVAAVESEISGWLRDAFKAVLRIAIFGHADYFAERLYLSMKGAGTDDKTLIRVITSRADVDMVEIRDAFQRKYGKSLSKFVEEDTSGDYKRFLLDLVN